MANPTPGTIKQDALDQIKKVVGVITDSAFFYRQYNRIRRDYRHSFHWGWGTEHWTPTFALNVTTGLYDCTMPTDWDAEMAPRLFSIIQGRPYAWVKSTYQQLFLPLADNGGLPLFFVDKKNRKITSNCGVGTFNGEYDVVITDLPLDTTQDLVPEPFPNGEAVTNGLIAYYLLMTQPAKLSKHQLFMQNYETKRDADIVMEGQEEPHRTAELTSSVRR